MWFRYEFGYKAKRKGFDMRMEGGGDQNCTKVIMDIKYITQGNASASAGKHNVLPKSQDFQEHQISCTNVSTQFTDQFVHIQFDKWGPMYSTLGTGFSVFK